MKKYINKILRIQNPIYYDKKILLIIGFVFISGHLSKLIISHLLDLFEVWTLNDFMRLVRVHNEGMFYGILKEYDVITLIVGFLIILVLIQSYQIVKHPNLLFSIGMGFILGGSVDNMVEISYNGYATDFIDIAFPPGIYNVADLYIIFGTVMVGLVSLSKIIQKSYK